jgi:cob(I)alamin adenosyltransferase
MEKGYIQVYTGDGKGKTTAAIGLAIRAAGHGKKTYIAQFMKKGEYGELILIKKYLSHLIQFDQFGLPEFHRSGNPVTEKEKKAAMLGIETVKKVLESGQFEIIILDEINILLYFGIIDEGPVLEILDKKPENMEIILTGRHAPPSIMERAHLITHMQEVKHYYNQQVLARSGIEK